MLHRDLRLLLALFTTGCLASEPGDPMDQGAATTPAQPGGVVRTRVYLQGDGTSVIKTDHITDAEADAERAARAAQRDAPPEPGARPRIAGDGGCASSSLWIFDNVNNTRGDWPFNNEVCFFAGPSFSCADLTQIPRACISTGVGGVHCRFWATSLPNTHSQVASFWSGSDTGYFTGAVGPGFAVTQFGTYERENDAQHTNVAGHDIDGVAYAQYVCL